MSQDVPNKPGSDDRATESADEGSRQLPAAAKRALAEAEARRQAQRDETTAAGEIGGQDGPDPVRYGDWEKGGIASDF